MQTKMIEFIRAHSVRALGVLAALVPILAIAWPRIPWEVLLTSAAALLGTGELTQRYQDAKALAALAVPAPTPVAPAAE